MPKAKPLALINSASTKEAQAARSEAEKSMTPKAKLTITPPASLRSHKIAAAMWKKIIKLYMSVEGQIVTSFDEDLLTQYCLLIEEIPWLSGMRTALDAEYQAIQKQVTQNRTLKITDESFKNYLRLLEQYGALLARLQGIDARLDGKRKLVHSLSQSLYLTPRSRAGVAPTEKETEEDLFGKQYD